MANCPACQNEFKEDFGIETCSRCGAVVFIDMDGKATIEENEEDSAAEALVEDSTSGDHSAIIPPLFEESLDDEDSESFISEDNISEEDLSDNEDFAENEDAETVTKYELTTESESLESELYETDDEFSSDYEAGDSYENEFEDDQEDTENKSEEISPAALIVEKTLTSAEDFFEDIEFFGNITTDAFQEAIYFFDFEIKGIDTKEMREEILESLDDSKLELNSKDLDRKIKNGILKLENIPAVKAVIIVHRLSHLKCQISWILKEIQDIGDDEAYEYEDPV